MAKFTKSEIIKLQKDFEDQEADALRMLNEPIRETTTYEAVSLEDQQEAQQRYRFLLAIKRALSDKELSELWTLARKRKWNSSFQPEFKKRETQLNIAKARETLIKLNELTNDPRFLIAITALNELPKNPVHWRRIIFENHARRIASDTHIIGVVPSIDVKAKRVAALLGAEAVRSKEWQNAWMYIRDVLAHKQVPD